MLKANRYAIGVLFLVLVASPAWSQTPMRSERDLLEAVKLLRDSGRRIIENSKDLTAYARGDPREVDRVILLKLAIESGISVVDKGHGVLILYLYTDCSPHRAEARKFVQRELDAFAERLDTAVEGVNNAVSDTSNAAIALSATRVKDEFRATKALLKSIKLP